jgi:hypothetical protein
MAVRERGGWFRKKEITRGTWLLGVRESLVPSSPTVLRTISSDWTLHATEASVNSSYRLVPPLRLLHLRLSDKSQLERFEATLHGYEEIISPENDVKMRETLMGICKRLASRADAGLRALDDFAGDTHLQFGTLSFDLSQTLKFIRWLWEEELDVANRLQQHIESGGEI